MKIVLIIDRRPPEERPGGTNESVLVGIVDLPFLVITEDELVFPPLRRRLHQR